ncbi:MAG: molybdenum cofactor biosynthesis protein MoeA, partial [Thermoprotei archaeon ex4572_64]
MYHKLVTPEEALEKIFNTIKIEPLGVEEVDLINAFNRVLAEDVYSPIDIPPFDRALMDGYAVRAEDTFGASELEPIELKLVGKVEAGCEVLPKINEKECVEIATGAPLPISANAVVMVEYTKTINDKVIIYRAVSPGENIASTGSDIAMGDLVLRKNTLLTTRELALLACIGVSKVKVYRRPKVSIISTGNELEIPGRSLRFGKIYDVNTYALACAVKEVNAEP